MTALAAHAGPSRWWHSRTTHRFMSHRLALLGVAMITSLTLACVFGPYLLPYDSLYIDLRARFAPPLTGNHYLGTDPLGRDVAARLLMAGRVSLLVGFCAMLLSTLIGTLVGVVAGYRGGWIGAALMRTVDGFLSFPSIFLVLALAAALRPTPAMIVVIISVTKWMEVARIVGRKCARFVSASLSRLDACLASAALISCSARSCPTPWARSSWPPP